MPYLSPPPPADWPYYGYGIDKRDWREARSQYDEYGRNCFGFLPDGTHYITKTEFDKRGMSVLGFGKDNRDIHGCDYLGYKDTGNHCLTYTPWNLEGIHRITGTEWCPRGFGRNGLHKDTGSCWGPDGNHRYTGKPYDCYFVDKDGNNVWKSEHLSA